MPTYAYRCACGHSEERFMKISEALSVRPCPECNNPEGLLKSPTAGQPPIFKGTGYYVTDFRRK